MCIIPPKFVTLVDLRILAPGPQGLIHPKYRPDIDGLRAIAVLSVVGYHAFPKWVPGGFIGVDVFFVISGFLISTIIFGNLERDNFSYIEFYARRIKRIFPALLVVFLPTLVVGWYVLFSDEFSQLGKHVAAGAGFVSNIILWGEAGYFDTIAKTKPLLHLWSLGIEEQFYILWPLLLGLVWHRKFNFLLTTLLVTLVSFAINIYWVNSDPTADFYSPFSRIWELMAGGILAYIVLHRPEYLSDNATLRSGLSVIGLALIGLSVVWFSKHTPFPGWWALLPTTGAFLVIAGRPDAWVNRYLLGNRLAVWVGLISYPLYLWHWPILAYAQIIEGGGSLLPERTTRISAVLVSILLAWATYVLVEKRFKRGYSKASIYFLSLSMVVFFGIGILVWKGFLLPRQNSEFINRVVTAANDWDWPGRLKPMDVGGEEFYIKEGAKTKTLFFGDSFLQQYAPRIVRLLEENSDYNTAVFATDGGCPPIPNVYENGHPWCPPLRDAAIEYINRQDVKTVVIGGAWSGYFILHTIITAEQKISDFSYYYEKDDHETRDFKGSNGAQLAMQELESFLRKTAKTKQVFLVIDNPTGKYYSPRSFFKGSRLTRIHESAVLKKNARADYDPEQQQLSETLKAIARRTGVRIIDPSEYLCDDQRCMVTTESGKPIYRDREHLRPFFVEQQAGYMDVTLQ